MSARSNQGRPRTLSSGADPPAGDGPPTPQGIGTHGNIEDHIDAPTRGDLLPNVGSLVWVLLLLAIALVVARGYAAQITTLLSAHSGAGVAVFVASTALAVVLPVFTNLPLVPFAVALWGSWWTALLLILGWVAGAVCAFHAGRTLRPLVLRAFPNVSRYARIDDLIHPRSNLLSLVMLRMTFPVDILSHALGLFSRKATAWTNATSAAIGTAPFALLFAFLPGLPLGWQLVVLTLSAVAFVGYVDWIIRRQPTRAGSAG